jgi:uncharacterized YigZ family protein
MLWQLMSEKTDRRDAVDAADAFLTLAARGVAELRVQRSRFLAYAAPAPDRAAADALVQAAAAQHPEATHCCWAYRVGYPERPLEHSSDAGEPSGTAGRPILAAIAQGGLWNAGVAVCRYFGGVKLGVRGLIEAYRAAAAEALANAPRVLRRPMATVRFTVAYGSFDTLRHRIQALGGTLGETVFAETIACAADVPAADLAAFWEIAHGCGEKIFAA